MMHSERRKIPVEVSVWTQKDVTVQKPTVNSGMMPDGMRLNVFCRRKFHNDLLNLSFQRQQNIVRRDVDTKKFLKRQREKAEKTMPGLLPYIASHEEDNENHSTSSLSSNSNRSIPLTSSTEKSSLFKSQSNFPVLPKIMSSRSSQPKSSKTHIRSNQLKTPTAEELIRNLDRQQNRNSSLPKIPERGTTRDARFQRLIYLFSDVHERQPSTIQSVQTLIQTNPALQFHLNPKQTKKMSTFDLIEENMDYIDEIRSISIDSKSDFYLIDACA